MIGRKLTEAEVERIFVLKVRDHLSHSLIARRLEISLWTVQRYVNDFRRQGRFHDPLLQKMRAVD